MTMRWFGPAIEARLREGAMQGVTEWIGLVEEEAVRLITQGSPSGRVYVRRGVKHQASAPGEPPASDTGTLVNAREVELITSRLAARLKFTAKYAPYLQHGTRKMAPRPFADVALNNTMDKGLAALQHHIMAALR